MLMVILLLKLFFKENVPYVSIPDSICFPKLKSRFLFGSSVPAIYQNYAGGVADGYYLPWQVAWESAQHVHLLERNVVTGQLGFRYRVKGKFYLTALGEYGKEARKFSHILIGDDLWGGALRASYDFVLGPVSIQLIILAWVRM